MSEPASSSDVPAGDQSVFSHGSPSHGRTQATRERSRTPGRDKVCLGLAILLFDFNL